MEASNVTGLLFKHLNFRGERQKVISSNIANINTPNYKTKDLVFKDELNKLQPILKMTRTVKNHFTNINLHTGKAYDLVTVKGLEEQNDGNNVNLDTQMSEMAKNKLMFDALQSSIKKDSRLFKSVIESSSKN